MKRVVTLSGITLGLLLAGGVSTAALAQGQPAARTQKHIVLQAKKLAKGRASGSRIKLDLPTTDVAKPRSRGETCQMSFVNHTDFHVKIYIDGTFNSMVGPRGSNGVQVEGLTPVIYCKTAGGTLEWNGGGECDMGVENVFDLRP